MSTAIEFNHVSKQYRLGVVSTRTLSHDLNRWWQMNILRKEDPYLKIGSVNDRSKAADSEYVWALKDIDFKVEQGDVVGIIGKNGAGKSTLLKLLSRVTGPTTGTIRAKGRIGSLLEVGTGFHPEMTGRENIYMNGAILGMSRQEITRKLDEIVDFSGCERYIDTPVKRYSSGMMVRLGFAVAAHLDPEILVVDEVLAVGDAEFQKKAIGKMQDVSKGEGRTVLFVSHNMASVQTLCKTGILLENGSIRFVGDIESTISDYMFSSVGINSNLSERTDRQGTQALQIVDCYLMRDGKKTDVLRLGDSMELFVGIRRNSLEFQEYSIAVAVNINNTFGQKVIQLSNKFIGFEISINSEISYYKFTLDRLAIKPGDYHIRFYLGDSVRILDWIDDAFTFRVERGDFYGLGIIEDSAMFNCLFKMTKV